MSVTKLLKMTPRHRVTTNRNDYKKSHDYYEQNNYKKTKK